MSGTGGDFGANGDRAPRVVGSMTNMEAAAIVAAAKAQQSIEWPAPVIHNPADAVFEIASAVADVGHALNGLIAQRDDIETTEFWSALSLTAQRAARASIELVAVEDVLRVQAGADQ